MVVLTFSPLVLLLVLVSPCRSSPTSFSHYRAPPSRDSSAHSDLSEFNIRTLHSEQSTLIRLSTPSLPLWNPLEHLGIPIPTSLLFNLTLSHCSTVLLLNGQPIYPFTSTPALLTAKQTDWSARRFASIEEDGLMKLMEETDTFELDYKQGVARPRQALLRLRSISLVRQWRGIPMKSSHLSRKFCASIWVPIWKHRVVSLSPQYHSRSAKRTSCKAYTREDVVRGAPGTVEISTPHLGINGYSEENGMLMERWQV